MDLPQHNLIWNQIITSEGLFISLNFYCHQVYSYSSAFQRLCFHLQLQIRLVDPLD